MEQQQRESESNWKLNDELSNTALPSLKKQSLDEKIYHGIRHKDGTCDVLVEQRLTTAREIPKPSHYPLPLHLEARNHSPTGFAWGYGGSGPAQLALALLID